MWPMTRKSLKPRGFTLIELAAVLTIGGVLMVAFGSMTLSYLRYSKETETRDKLERIQTALNQYLDINGKYPCPAVLTADEQDSDYSVESKDDCSSDTSGTYRVSGFSGVDPDDDEASDDVAGRIANPGGSTRVRIGALPISALRLPATDIADGWQNKFFYAVTIGLTDRTTFNQAGGAIAIVDSEGNHVQKPAGKAHYVIVSFGENGNGAYTFHGRLRKSCSSSSLEERNCSHASSTFSNTTLRSDSFDDIVVFGAQTKPVPDDGDDDLPTGAVVPFNLNACPTGWTEETALRGRVIYGAGHYAPLYPAMTPNDEEFDYTRGDEGGFAKMKLSVAQMAPHTHNFYVNLASVQAAFDTVNGVNINLPVQLSWVTGGYLTSYVGGNMPQENRRPFMAFLYCKKS